MDYKATDIVYQAQKFENASLILEQNHIKKNNNLVKEKTLILNKQSFTHEIEPALTLCGLSLELYLKAIYFHENGKPKNGHDIFKLYNSLSPNSKNSIINFFNTNKESFIKIYENFITHNHIKIISFEETLKELSDIFISMRYMYENLSIQKNLLFRELMRQSFVNRINELNFLDYLLD
ncbi:HEPN domain-containing protein [Epilithonimonas arachidiradicis]|uniref:HEPN domain-containing protein n=1 Tax=Epilithonimonas arachidiradicis TaxID=1617282 RepID=A0A420DBY0_9FLAO|nr:HEPN domain-containing protein [Epilithonimonas arachidiradicis]RKE89020.1 HEPN domain-containing protein [Epilithonimonas arachidiradicis]GGG53186.1 hypothetical protein GCM10007332_13580 [Epilithonimonas arachidiradicis]